LQFYSYIEKREEKRGEKEKEERSE